MQPSFPPPFIFGPTQQSIISRSQKYSYTVLPRSILTLHKCLLLFKKLSLPPSLPLTNPSSAVPNSIRTPCCPNPVLPHTVPCSYPRKHPSLDSILLAREWSGRSVVCSLRIPCQLSHRRRQFSRVWRERKMSGGGVSLPAFTRGGARLRRSGGAVGAAGSMGLGLASTRPQEGIYRAWPSGGHVHLGEKSESSVSSTHTHTGLTTARKQASLSLPLQYSSSYPTWKMASTLRRLMAFIFFITVGLCME